MGRWDFDFSRAQPRLRARAPLAGTLVLAAGVGVAVYLGVWFADLQQRAQVAENRIARLRELDPRTALRGQQASERIAAEVKSANLAIARLAVPWERLFVAIEASRHDRVVLLSLQPNLAAREVRIVGEAQDFAAIREYLERLAANPVFSSARLGTHEVSARPGEAGGIRFDATAAWRLETL